MTSVFHRQIGPTLPVAVRGDGVFILDQEGRRYLDASGGAAVSCLGHSDAGVRKAITQQIDAIAFAHTSFFTNRPMEELAAELVASAPAGLEKVYFVSGGSEAVEAAIKMARQYFLEIGQASRSRIIARRQSYHGNTSAPSRRGQRVAAGAVSAAASRRAAHLSLLRVSRAAARRDGRGLWIAGGGRTRNGNSEARARDCRRFHCRDGRRRHGRAVPPVPGYFRRIREICDRYGVLLILDEVMCGMGRTGTLFACEQEGIAPDLLTIAKGLGAGYQPIGAVMVSGRIHDAFAKGSGFFQHGHTYMGHATACAAGLAVQRAIRERGLLANVRERGAELRAALDARLGGGAHVGDIRGRGCSSG